jgi:hypothetical protein
MKKLLLKPMFNAFPAESSGSVVAFSVGPTHEIMILHATQELDTRIEQSGWASFFKTKPDKLQSYILSVWVDKEQVQMIEIKEEEFNITEVQPINGNYLLVCPRCDRKSDSDIEKNGRLYDSSGKLIKKLILGDGIQYILSTLDKELWVSYFDEGIFGNYGWSQPLGSSGLVKWSLDGEALYEYKPEAGLNSISDCYAMNIDSGGDVWICYYTDFPIVRINEGAVVGHWRSPVFGSDSLCVAFPYVLFFGDYEDKDVCQLVKLETKGKAIKLDEFRICNSAGERFNITRVAVRASKLYFLAEGNVYCVDVSECVAYAS